jgi:membrane protease YdiL (CAAX protease family)
VLAGGFLLALLLLNRYIDKGTLGQYGINLDRDAFKIALRASGYGVLLVLVIVIALWCSDLITLRDMFYSTPKSQYGFLILFIGQLSRYVFGSFFEEVMSRAFLIRHLAEGISWKDKVNDHTAVWIACLFTSLLFGLLHFSNPGANIISSINLSLLGLLFAFSYVFSGKLAWPIGLHFGWNICQNNVFGFANSGKVSEAAITTFNLTGPDLWTGGVFGLEASLLTTIVLICVIAIILWREYNATDPFDFKIYLNNS